MGRVPKDILGEVCAYWDRLRGDRAMPSRSDIDPVDIPRLLPNVILVDVIREPRLDFAFRLIGTGVDSIIARNYVAKRFSDIPHMASGSRVWAQFAEVAGGAGPLSATIDYIGSDRFVRGVRHCLMPLSQDGTNVNMIFVAVEIDRA